MASTSWCRTLPRPSTEIHNEQFSYFNTHVFLHNSDDAKVAKRKLQMLNNHVFEELAMDVYDEVDRRETDAIWNSLVSKVNILLMKNSQF